MSDAKGALALLEGYDAGRFRKASEDKGGATCIPVRRG